MTLVPGTKSVAKEIDPAGALYQQRAAKALPLLIRQAEAGGVPISYEQLSRELEMVNPRNLNYVLGSIGVSLARLGEAWKQPIPPLQALVTNKSTGLPGDGFVEFLLDPAAFRRASRAQQRSVIRKLAAEAAIFRHWREVLDAFGLSPWSGPALPAPPTNLDEAFGGGESSDHKAFKDLVSRNPTWFGIGDCQSLIEYSFPTGDAVDVLFATKDSLLGVEVKSRISAAEDIHRGLFQCVKYRALLQAACAAQGLTRSVDSYLACEGSFPSALVGVAHALGVEFFEQLGRKRPA